MTKIALDTIGCKLNQAETELLAVKLAEAGYRLVSPTDEADVYILNTCTVTHVADRKCRHWLRQAHERSPGARLVAVGCYAGRASGELARLDGVDMVVGNGEKSQIPELLRESGCIGSPSDAHAEPVLRTRSFVKVQDGCSSFCAYCIVPMVRGGEKSLPAGQVVAEVGRRAADGYKEAVLTGTEIGAYQHEGFGLEGLLERILAETDISRLRLSSLQPQEISPGLIRLWSDGRLCRHFHLSLQSGSDAVLGRMKRGYKTANYRRAVSLIRDNAPEAAITTDIIVGFPGETAEEFRESYNFCKEMEFARIHVFPYSAREGTAAALMKPQVADKVKKQRSREMLELGEESIQNFSRRFLGKAVTVLWEQRTNGVWSGHTDNYIKVYARSGDELTNKLLPVKLTEIRGDGVWGEMG